MSATDDRGDSDHKHQHSRWLGHGRTRTGTGAAASGLAEVGPPYVVVRLRVLSAQPVSPDGVVRRVDDAVVVVVAGQERSSGKNQYLVSAERVGCGQQFGIPAELIEPASLPCRWHLDLA